MTTQTMSSGGLVWLALITALTCLTCSTAQTVLDTSLHAEETEHQCIMPGLHSQHATIKSPLTCTGASGGVVASACAPSGCIDRNDT
jgi:hypothetical protein